MNQELSKNTKYSLTKRHIMNERARLAQQLAKINDMLLSIGLGEAQATAPQVSALKTIQGKLLADITPEDFDKSTTEPGTLEEDMIKLAGVLDEQTIIQLTRLQRKEATRIHETLGQHLQSKVVPIIKAIG